MRAAARPLKTSSKVLRLPMSVLRPPPRFKGKKVSKTYALPEDMHDWIEERARERATNRSEVLRELAEHSIDAEMRGAGPLQAKDRDGGKH